MTAWLRRHPWLYCVDFCLSDAGLVLLVMFLLSTAQGHPFPLDLALALALAFPIVGLPSVLWGLRHQSGRPGGPRAGP
jgi:hypothetical protein